MPKKTSPTSQTINMEPSIKKPIQKTRVSKIRELEEQLAQRNAELAIINSVQAALAAELNIQGIYQAVGDKVREIFHNGDVSIRIYDPKTNLVHYPYTYEYGERFTIDSEPLLERGFARHVLRTRETLLIDENMTEEAAKYGAVLLPGTQMPKSQLFVPLVTGNQARGIIDLVDMKHEHAFSESDVRLLQTLANAMSVALENARLFDETQRLLKETEDRAAELAIINSVQQGLASKLDVQAIYELVGDKIRDIFDAQVVDIGLYDNKDGLIQFPYTIERDVRFPDEPIPVIGFRKHVMETRQYLLVNEKLPEIAAQYGNPLSIMGEPPQSALYVPMIVGSEAKGVISLQNLDREHAFSESDVRLLQTLANSMSVALENARLFDEVQKKNAEITEALEQQTATSDVLRAMSGFQPDLRSLLEIIAINVAKVCGADDAHIYRLEEKKLMEWTHRGPIPGLEAGQSLPLNRGSVIGRAIIDRQIIHIHDAQMELSETEYPVSFALQRRWGYHTVLAIPLLRDGEPIGGIAIRREEIQPFTEKQIELIKTFADQAVIAIENVRLFEETQRLLKDTQVRNAELAIINSVQQGLASKLEMQAIYDLIGDKIRDLFGAQVVIISTFDRQANLNHLKYAIERGTRISVPPLPIRERLVRYLDETHQSLVINQDAIQVLSEYGIEIVADTDAPKSLVYVPLIVGDEVKGTISLQNLDRANAFSESDVRLLQTLANSMSVALENARLFDETQRLLKETEQRAQELAIINSVQEGLASKLDMQAIFDLVGDKIRDMFSAQSVIISSFDHENQLARLEYAFEDGQRVYDDELLPFSPLNRYLIDTRQPVVINENSIEEAKRYGLKIIEGTRAPKSLIYVPFGTGTRVNGYFSLQNMERENAFAESDVRLLQTLAGSMGIAIENARLSEEIQNELSRQIQAKEREEHRRVILEKVITTGQHVTEVHDVPTTLRRIWHGVHNDLDFDRVGMYLFNRERHSIDATFGTNDQGEIVDEWQTSISLQNDTEAARFFLQVIEKPDTILLTHTYESDYNIPEGHIMSGVQDFAAIGAWAGAKPVAVLCVDHKITGRRITDEQLEALRLFAGYAGLAIENARLSEEIQNELSRQIQAKEKEEHRRLILEKVITTGQHVTEVHDVRTTLTRIWHGVHDELGFDRVGLYLFNPERNSMDGTFGTNNRGEMIDEWHTWVSLDGEAEGGRSFLRLIEKPDTIVLTHSYESDNKVPEGHIMSGVQDFAAIGAWAGTKPVAAICVDHHITGRHITDEQLEALRLFAGYAGLAIENARLFDETQRLFKAEQQRAAELAIINSVQEGLASKLNMQAVYELVGDKIQEIFDAQVVTITTLDMQTGLSTLEYGVELGKRIEFPTSPFTGLEQHLVRTRQTILIDEDTERRMAQLGGITVPGTAVTKSNLFVPMLVGDELKGYVSLQNVDREHAFSESDVRLLQTLANSMSVALENARLFDETQRLLKETEQRNAELAIINNISQALASELDLQAVIDLVGDKLLEVFHTQDAFICLYDRNSNLLEFPYSYTLGVRDDQKPMTFGQGLTSRVITTRLPLVINQDFQKRAVELGAFLRDERDLPIKAWMGVPIIVSDQVIGAIGLLNLEYEHAFSDLDVRLLETLASNMGVAIQNARSFQAEKQRATELAAISTVSQALVAETELEAMIQLIGSQTRETFQADIAYVALVDPQTNRILFPYQHGEDFTPLMLGEGLTSKIIESGEPLLINKDIKERRAQLGTTLVGREALSYLGVPIKAGKETIGVLSVQSVTEEGVFDENDLRLLTTIAANAGAAIHTAQLHAETQRRAREMATLAEVGRDISSSLEASTVLEGIAKHAKELLNGNLSALFIPEGDGTIFRAIAAVGEEAEQVRNDTIKMGQGVLGDLARRRVGEIINDTNADPRTILIAGTDEVPDEHLLAVPLLANDALKGLMAVWRTGKGKEFIEAELEFLNNLARQAVIAIQNTHLFEEAKEARAAAEQANRAKSTFLANMSHELRTPLNAIIGFTRIVRKKSDGLLPQKQLENLDKVLTSSEHLLSLINTVLDIAKIEAGRMDVIAGKFSISALADQCINLATPLLKPRVILEKQVDVNLGIIYSDQDKIKQIVLNLLSNAAKFTHDGQITLRIEKCDEDTLRISVADSGIGISEEALARIFDEFQQADSTTTRQYGGTGLGLAISRNLARLLGGELTATSALGKGSTFSLTIPIHYGRKGTAQPEVKLDSVHQTDSYSQADAAKKRVLVIDDDPDAAYLLQESLSQNEFAVIGAPNGRAGLQLAKETQPDAILLDILMPETDGWQVLNDLKTDKATVDIPVILLTIVDKKALGFKLGAAAYLLKPLDPTVVLETLRRVIGEKEHPHKHVLVVDDDPNVAEMLRQTLPESDFVLAAAEDGEAGLLAIKARRPDVILLDLMMPKLNGFGVIERLRADSDLRNIPIIVISAKDLTEEESKTLKESVAFVMKKQGFNGDLLMEEINSVVKKN